MKRTFVTGLLAAVVFILTGMSLALLSSEKVSAEQACIWAQTSKADFEGGTIEPAGSLDLSSSPGDAKLAKRTGEPTAVYATSLNDTSVAYYVEEGSEGLYSLPTSDTLFLEYYVYSEWYKSYVRFPLSGASEPLSSATLYLYEHPNRASGGTTRVHHSHPMNPGIDTAQTLWDTPNYNLIGTVGTAASRYNSLDVTTDAEEDRMAGKSYFYVQLQTTPYGSASYYCSADWAGTDKDPYLLVRAALQHYPSSTLVSSAYDTMPPADHATSYGTISWTPTDQPAQCGADALKFQVATNNDNATWNFVGPDGTGSTYYTQAAGQGIWSGHTGDRYIKYKAYFSTANTGYTPTLSDVSITYYNVFLGTTIIEVTPLQPDAADGWYRTIPSIVLTRNKPGATYYQWDSTGGSWTTYSTAISAPGGEHALYYYSVFADGNVESPVNVQYFKVNTGLPSVILSTHGTCESCHGPGAITPGGDISGPFTSTPHDTELSAAPAKCDRCHDMNGSPLPYLLRASIKDNAGFDHPVDGLNNSVCYACHASANFAYSSKTLFENSRHFMVYSSGKALTRNPDESYGSGMCGNCHSPHGVYGTTDYLRSAGNSLCTGCHDDLRLQAKPGSYSYQGDATYNGTQHGSTSNIYNVWPNPAETGGSVGTGGATSGQCINCHNPHAKDDGGGNPTAKLTLAAYQNLCYGGSGTSGGCHASPVGSASGVNVYSEFHTSSDSTAHHSLGSNLECANCHNPHASNRTLKMANPDIIGSSYTLTMIDPTTGEVIPDYIDFCLRCHDNDPPATVTITRLSSQNYWQDTGLMNIRSAYLEGGFGWLSPYLPSASYGANYHGSRAGPMPFYKSPTVTLKPPYFYGMGSLPCTDCHSEHGSANNYHLKEVVNGQTVVAPITARWTDVGTGRAGSGVESFCFACHTGTNPDIPDENEFHMGCGYHNSPPVVDYVGRNCLECHTHYYVRSGTCHAALNNGF